MAITDVTVFGAGIFGMSVAYACLKRGANVTLCDPNGPGTGASGGLVGALAPHVPELWNNKKQFQLESLLMAQEFWDDIEQASGLPSGYKRSGRLQPLASARLVELAHERTVKAVDLWQGKADWRVLDENPHPGWGPASPTGFWVYDTLSARMSPRMAGPALAAAFQARGGKITTTAPEKGVCVWATGIAGLIKMSKVFSHEVGNGVKGQSALLGHDARDLPQVFSDGVHIIPHADGNVAVGSTSERYYDDPNTTDQQLEDVLERAYEICPALRAAPVLERWAGLRPRASTRSPMLGAWPNRAGHFIANGGFKIGFGMAPKVGEVMADLVLENRDTIPEGFRVEDNL